MSLSRDNSVFALQTTHQSALPLSPRSQYTQLLYGTLDHTEVVSSSDLTSFFKNQIISATKNSGGLSDQEKTIAYHVKNLFNDSGKIRPIAAELLLTQSPLATAQRSPRPVRRSSTDLVLQTTHNDDSSSSTSSHTPPIDPIKGALARRRFVSEESDSHETDQTWLTTEIEDTLGSLCIERVFGENFLDGFYPYPKFFPTHHRLILHKTVDSKSEQYASFGYKNFIFEFILKEDGTVGIEPKYQQVMHLPTYPKDDLPVILEGFRRGRFPTEIKDLILYGPAGKSVCAAVTNGFLAAAGYMFEKAASATGTVENYVPSVIATPVGKALAAYLISGTAGYFGVTMSPAAIVTFLGATQDIGHLASNCALTDVKKTAFDDFSEAYRNRNWQKKSQLIEFAYQKEKMTNAQPLISLTDGIRLKLSSDQQTSIATACSLSNDLERKRRISRQITKEDHAGWEVIHSSDDVAGVYRYDEKNNELLIAFRSSIKGREGNYIEDPDARIHLTAVPHHPLAHGIDLEGKMHAGFLKKYEGCKGFLYESLQAIFARLEQDQLKDLRIILGGHSMGAAISQIAAADLCKNVLPKVYKQEALSNRVWVLSISSPCIGDEEATGKMEALIGLNNCIRLNVAGDLMTIAGSQEMLNGLSSFSMRARKIPAIEQLLDCLVFKPMGNSILLPQLQTDRPEPNSLLEDSLLKIMMTKEYKEGITTIFRHFLAPAVGGEFHREAFEGIRLERLNIHSKK